jgi:putative ABC transport system permease protein
MKIRQRLRSALWRVPVEDEVRDELTHHLDLRTEELVERGMDRTEARAEAIRRFGDINHMQQHLTSIGHRRDQVIERREWFGELRQDVAFALRQCRLQPGFTFAAVLTLALGIGATTAIFSVVHAVVLKPLPFADPDRLLQVSSTWRNLQGSTSVGNFDYIRRRVTTLEQMAAVQFSSFNLAEGGNPERVAGFRTTWNYFQVFGISPLFGRTYTAEEDQPGAPKVVVLSHRLWNRRFGGDPAIIGRQIRMNGEPHAVIGILPPSIDQLDSGDELYVPIAFTAERLAMHDEHYLSVFGRQKTDTTLEQVNEELARIAAGLRADFPRDNAGRGVVAQRFSETLVANYETRLYVLLAAVGLVLLIACANVANLLLARLAARSRELAIRAAIGAGRGRIVRQVITESLVLAGLGGVAGLLLAWWALPVLVASAPAGIPRLTSASLNSTVVAAAVLLVVVSAVVVGFLPAWQSTRGRGLRETLGDGKGAGGAALKPWVRQTLIAAQAALVLIVLAGAALLVRTSVNLQQMPIGFDTSGVLSARIALPAAEYRGPEKVKATFRELLDKVAVSPGVSVAALDSQPPLVAGGGSNGLIPEGRPQELEYVVQSQSHFVSEDYFRVLRIPLKAGRSFTPQDVRSAPLVMIINETLAREAFGAENPIGKRISCCEGVPGRPSWKIVVGVVADVRARGPAQPPRPEFYLPIAQIPDVAWSWVQNAMNVIARTEAGDPAALAGVIRSAVHTIDPELPVYRIETMEHGLRQTMAQARFNTSLMTLLGLSGLVLAALGIYSVVAWLVAQRTREIGVRMALGATASEVVRSVMVHGLKPVTIGLAVGLVGALGAGKLLESQLFQIGSRDPIALGSVVAMMVTIGALAAVIPAWRASSIDPAQALHDQ